MIFTDGFFMDIKKIYIAHEFILGKVHRCEYPNGRGVYGLVYVISGKADYRFSTGEHVTVTDGDTLFLSPHAAYTIVIEKEFKHYTVNFDIHEDTSRLDLLDALYCQLNEDCTDSIKRGFTKLTSIWQAREAGFEMQAAGCLYELLSLFYLGLIGRHNTASHQRLIAAKEYIEQHFDRPIALWQLAKLSNMSVTNFRREWKKRYTEAPLQYRDNLRLYYAKEYLDSGYYTVSKIAEICGFDDVSYFIRFFKKKTGMTPNAYKKKYIP